MRLLKLVDLCGKSVDIECYGDYALLLWQQEYEYGRIFSSLSQCHMSQQMMSHGAPTFAEVTCNCLQVLHSTSWDLTHVIS